MRLASVVIALCALSGCKTSSSPADAEGARPDAAMDDAQTPADQDQTTVDVNYIHRDEITSEDGPLSLEEGELFLESLTLVEDETGAEVPWLEAVRFDLAASQQEIPASWVRPGTYGRMRAVFRHPDPSAPTFAAKVTDANEATARVAYLGTATLPEPSAIYPAGPIVVSEQSGQPTLTIDMSLLFFYLWPISRAEEGVLTLLP